MSRSIHANRSLRHRRQEGGIDRAAVDAKRELKLAALRDRGLADEPLPIATAEDIPIRRVDVSPSLYFPTSVEDMRAVLLALPKGVTTALAEIRLEIGRAIVNEAGRRFDMIDPAFGRLAVEDVPGVFVPISMGVYEPGRQLIRIFGYSKAPKHRITHRQQTVLELQMLSALVHEVIHHHDWMHRMGRGRSADSFWNKSENYTRALTKRWVQEYVIPYLSAKHGEADGIRLARWARDEPGNKWWRMGVSRAEQSRRRAERRATMTAARWKWMLNAMRRRLAGA